MTAFENAFQTWSGSAPARSRNSLPSPSIAASSRISGQERRRGTPSTSLRVRTSKPQLGHFEAAGAAPRRWLRESRVSAEEAEQFEVGQQVGVDVFSEGQRVDVIGTSKGRGTAGVVKRHGFAIKRRTHGTHEFFRHGGAIGAGAYPGKVIKGMKMPGRLGNARVTTTNVEVVGVDAEKHLLFIRGSVPGHNDALVRIRPARKASS